MMQIGTIGSGNGLVPTRRPMLVYCLLSIATLETYSSEIIFEIQYFHSKKMQLKMSSGIWLPFCLNALIPECVNPPAEL